MPSVTQLGLQPRLLTSPSWLPPSFKDCIPRSFRLQIRRHNALTRLRLRSIFRRFVRAFQPGHISQQVIMVKYLATLEQLAPRFGTERVPVCHLELLAQAVGKSCYIRDSGQAPPEPELATGPPTHEVLVTGTGGIQWRPVQAEVSRVHLGIQVRLGLLLCLRLGLRGWLPCTLPPHGSGMCLSIPWGGFLGSALRLCLPPGDLISGVCTCKDPLSGIEV